MKRIAFGNPFHLSNMGMLSLWTFPIRKGKEIWAVTDATVDGKCGGHGRQRGRGGEEKGGEGRGEERGAFTSD